MADELSRLPSRFHRFFDNPAGKEPISLLEDIAKIEGFEMRTFAVPSPGIEMAAQVLDITDQVLAAVRGQANLRAEQIQKSVNRPPAQVKAALAKLREQGKVTTAGKARGTTYAAV